jgi:hypothetical protein
LHRVDEVDVKPQQLQGKDCAFVPDVAMYNMTLDGQHSLHLANYCLCAMVQAAQGSTRMLFEISLAVSLGYGVFASRREAPFLDQQRKAQEENKRVKLAAEQGTHALRTCVSSSSSARQLTDSRKLTF